MSKAEKIQKFLDEAKVFYLSTIDGDKPRCRPLGLHHLQNDKIYYGVGGFKEAYQQLEKNPNCELVALKGSEWIRINGKAIFEKDFVLSEKFLNDNPHLKEMYAKNNWKLMVFHIEGNVEIRKIMTTTEKFEI